MVVLFAVASWCALMGGEWVRQHTNLSTLHSHVLCFMHYWVNCKNISIISRNNVVISKYIPKNQESNLKNLFLFHLGFTLHYKPLMTEYQEHIMAGCGPAIERYSVVMIRYSMI